MRWREPCLAVRHDGNARAGGVCWCADAEAITLSVVEAQRAVMALAAWFRGPEVARDNSFAVCPESRID